MSGGRFVRENSLGLGFGALFLVALVGQAVAGWHQFNADQVADSLVLKDNPYPAS